MAISATKRITRHALILAFFKACVALYLLGTLIMGVTDKTYQMLELERAQKISTISLLRQGGRGVGIKPRSGITDSALWRPTVASYPSVEIYPVFPNTGESLFPSRLTGIISTDQKHTLSLSVQTKRLFVSDHRDKKVLRVSGLVHVGTETVVVNSDVDAWDVFKAHWIRLVLHLVMLATVVYTVFLVRRMPRMMRYDAATLSTDDINKARMFSEIVESLEVDVCVASFNEKTGESKIEFSTRNFDMRFRYRIGELLGKPLEIFIPDDKQSWHKEAVREAYTLKRDIPLRQVTAVCKDGSAITVNLDVKMSKPIDGQIYMVASVR